MEYRWKINLTGTLPDGHTPDLTITLVPGTTAQQEDSDDTDAQKPDTEN
jgi:hypothetical protein